jgi:hypothetical protein
MVIFILLVWVWTLGPEVYSYAGSLLESRDRAQLVADDLERTEAEKIHRENAVRDDVRRMRELCRIFEEGAAGANAKNRTEVEIYRKSGVSADESRMLEFCRNLDQETAPSGPDKRTEVEVTRKDPAPGVSEYRREYRESNRYPATSADKDRMLHLCRELERDFGSGR